MKSTLRRKQATERGAPVRVVIGGELEIPPITNLEEFREWARSDSFPERARIDYIDGRIEVDEVTEDALTRGTPKAEIARVILNRVRELRLGQTFVDSMRVSCPSAGVSVEPDIVVVSHEALSSGRVRLVPAQSMKSRRYVELEGGPDLVVEVLSDSSVERDTARLDKQDFESEYSSIGWRTRAAMNSGSSFTIAASPVSDALRATNRDFSDPEFSGQITASSAKRIAMTPGSTR